MGQAVHVLCGLGNSDLGTAVGTGWGEISWKTKFALEKYDENSSGLNKF